ncbi:hypothetical protein [Lysobacter xanthus]
MISTFIRGLRRGLVLLALMLAANSAFAARLVYMGGHSLDGARLAALGHTLAVAGPSDGNWTAVLAAAPTSYDAIIVGEASRNVALQPTTVTAIRNYVANGGRMLVVGDHFGSVYFMNTVLGYATSAAYGCVSDSSIGGTKLTAATGTFAIGPASLTNESCTSALNLASVPVDMRTVYGTAGTALVAQSTGAKRLTWLGWDYCCSSTQQQGDDWYIVLDNAVRFSGFFTTCSAEGFTGTQLTMCRQVCETASLSTSARAGMVKIYNALYGPAPSCPLLQTASLSP